MQIEHFNGVLKVKNNRTKAQNKQQGFTLIELIVVIVILGIMSAVAVPQFINLQQDAKQAVMQGVEGSVRSAATLVYSKALIEGVEGAATATVTIQTGLTVDTVFGYPAATAAGIVAAVDLTGATNSVDATTTAGTFSYINSTTCDVVYTAAAAAGSAPTISNDLSDC